MASIQQIESNLLTASRTGNLTLLNSTLSSITTAQQQFVSGSVLITTLQNITYVANATTASNMTRALMSKLGSGIEPSTIGQAAAIFALNKNYAALDAVTDFLTSAQKLAIPSGLVSDVVEALAYNDNRNTTSDDVTIANAVRDVMSKLGVLVDPVTIGQAAAIFAANKNYAALDAVTDYLTSAQKLAIPSGLVSDVVEALAYNDNRNTTSDDVTIANAVRDVMSKLGGLIDPATIAESAEIFIANKNYVALDALIGELSTPQYSLVSRAIADDLAESVIKIGNDGANTFNGTAGHDVYLGRNGADIIKGGNGNDTLFGDGGTDILYGDAGNDVLYGGSGIDQLFGGAGNDLLAGGKGADVLSGGAGSDRFYFDAEDLGTGVDTIKDFKHAEGDRIDISDILEQHSAGDVIGDFVRLTQSGGNTILQVDIDGKGSAASFASVAIIEGGTPFTVEQLIANGNLIV